MRSLVLGRVQVDFHAADRIRRRGTDILMTMVTVVMVPTMVMLMFVMRCHLGPISSAGFAAPTSFNDGASHRGRVNSVAVTAEMLARQRTALRVKRNTYSLGLFRLTRGLSF